MRVRRRLARSALMGAMVLTLAGSGCPGNSGEEILYCFVLNAITSGEHGVENCDIYEIPGERRAVLRYEDDFRAYQALAAFGGATAPSAPTPAAFMASRYPDWPARAASLRATLAISAPQTPRADAALAPSQ